MPAMTKALARKIEQLTSNNPYNRNKNLCALAVAKALSVHNETRYLHTWGDLQRAIRKLWSFRSVMSVTKADGKSVEQIRKRLKKHDAGACGYVVRVKGHVLLLDENGNTFVDTAPVKKDTREVLDVYGVYLPKRTSKYMELLKRANQDD
jgi:hypothetical protein